ncbi:MAG: signal peptide peptidase SppA [Candidatus Paceibacterota bacterium]
MIYQTFGRELAGVAMRAVAVVVSIFLVIVFVDAWYNLETVSDGSCNVAVLPIEGVILPFTGFDDYSLVTTPGQVRDFVTQAENDLFIKAILLDINSPGGTPVSSEQIAEYISQSELPSVGLIGDVGASGAYLIAASTDSIVASPMSDVGSIGVTMSYVENSKQNEEEGLTFVELSSGKFKDAGSPEKPLSDEERELFEKDLQIVHDEFVKKIAEYRHKSVEEIEQLADGSAMPGVKALEAGLVDHLGNRETAREVLSGIMDVDAKEVIFCEYENNSLLI